MQNRTIFLLAAVIMLALMSCTQTTAPSIDSPRGMLRGSLVMFDSTGQNPVNGKLTVNRGMQITSIHLSFCLTSNRLYVSMESGIPVEML